MNPRGGWRRFFWRNRWDAERASELEAHISHETDENIARGMSPGDARDAARRKLGNETKIREEIYRMNSVGFLETLWQDVKYGARALRKSPGYTLVAVITLALGIGANTVIFSVINTVLLRRLPYPDVQQLALLFRADAHDRHDTSIDSMPDYEDWKRGTDVFSSMALFDPSRGGYNLAEGTHPERLQGVRITSEFFKTFGAPLFMGREFLPDEERKGNDREVILSYELWKRRYAEDPAIVGKSIRIDGQSYTVVGIAGKDFRFQFWGNPGDLFVPVGYTTGDMQRGSHSFAVVARMKPGVSISRADAEMDAIGKRLAVAYPESNADETFTALSLESFGVSELKPTLMVLFYVVGFVLLIACVNVANLSLARSATRQKEIAVRRALGAGRFRVMRQLLTESLLLATLGCAAGLILAQSSLLAIEKSLPDQLRFMPFRPITTIPMDARVFAFAILVTCVTAVLFGMVPAFSAERTDPAEILKAGGLRGSTRVHTRLGRGLIAVELALAMIVVVSAGLLIDSVTRLLRVDSGFRTHNVLKMDISTPETELYYGPPVNGQFCRQVQESVSAIPGVTAVSAVSMLPLQGNAGRGIDIESHPQSKPEDQYGAGYMIACPDSLKALGIALVQGRDFTNGDTPDAPGVAIVNEDMAKKFWPHENVIGQRFKIGRMGADNPWMTIVGVMHDVRQGGLDRDVMPVFVRPFAQAGWPQMSIIVKTEMAPMAVAESARRALAAALPETPVADVTPLDEVVRESVSGREIPMIVLSAFAFLALVLAAVGIAGVVSYGVAQRTQEIGIRMALGAESRDVLKMIVGDSMKWALAGVAAGAVGALLATRLLSDLLFNVKAADPWVLGGVACLLAAVALAASYLPARKATRVDPLVALRYE